MEFGKLSYAFFASDYHILLLDLSTFSTQNELTAYPLLIEGFFKFSIEVLFNFSLSVLSIDIYEFGRNK